MSKTSHVTIGSSTLGVLLILGIAVALNTLMSGFGNLRKDMTEEKLYTLSDSTLQLLDGLERDVTFKLYFSRSADNLPIALKQYAQRIEDLLSEYAQRSGGKIVLETYDPQPDSDEEEWAQKYGVQPQALNILRGDNLYLGVVASSGSSDETLPFISPNAEPQLEYLLSRLVVQVTQPQRPILGVLSSLPVMGSTPPQMPYGMPQQQRPQPRWLVISELERQYELREIPEAATDIPEEISTLLVIHPKQLSQDTLFAIDQFVLRGGRLMLFVDALCLTDMQNQPNPGMMGMGMNTSSELNALTSAWGYSLATDQLIGDPASATQISGPGGRPERSDSWLSLRGDSINREEIATESLDFVMAPFAGYFDGTAKEGLTATPLIQASEESGTLATYLAMSGQAKADSLSPRSRLPIALRLQGSFKTAFPSGPPVAASPENDESPAAPEPGSWLKESTEHSLVLLVADVDLLYDRFMVRQMNMMGQMIAEPINDNLNFVLNAVEMISGNEALIGLRSRGRYERPFHRVNEMEKIASAKYQQEETLIQAELDKAQQRLSELQQVKTADQMMIITPEQQAEIEKFQEEVFKSQHKLREVRKNLRKDIEALGLSMKVINIAALPLLVAAFGITRGLRRKQKASQLG